jgi:trimethylamine--corrinoid protein Co-methyltransferase
MMDYENCISLEKLIIDHEIARMAYRLIDGVTQRDEPMALGLFADILRGEEFMSLMHTVHWVRTEHWYPKIIDRGGAEEWIDAGKPTLADRAATERKRLLEEGAEPILAPGLLSELRAIMRSHASAYGMDKLPEES